MKKIIYTSLLVASFFALYSPASALTVSIEKPAQVVQVGDTVIVKVLLDTENQEINALEGTISISGNVKVESVYTGGSVFTLWPVFPVYKNREISFVGGAPSSVFGSKLQVFTIALTPQKKGSIMIDVSKLTAYLADGNGSSVSSFAKKMLSISVSDKLQDNRNDLEELLKNDTTPPERFNIEYSRDASVYEGKVFLSFYTTDSQSGIVGYDVTEEGKTYRVDDGIYILKNQDLVGTVTVTAIDVAGNKRSEEISFGSKKSMVFSIIVGLALLVLFAVVWRLFYKSRNEKI